MVRCSTCAGMAMGAFGLGLMLGALLGGVLCPLLLGVGCLVGGAVLVQC